MGVNSQKQTVFNEEMKEVQGPIEADLRKKKHLLIDAKSIQNIKSGKVGFKVFDQGNSMKITQDKQTLSYENRAVDKESKELDCGLDSKFF